ncbi:unnamed protein product, partial [Mesorhabditis spiculigera]
MLCFSKWSKKIRKSLFKLAQTAEELKAKVSPEAIMPTESIAYPTVGYDSDCNAVNTLHIDNFLFTDDDVDQMVDEGKVSRYYCKQCGSKDLEALNFISHSLSKEQIEFMFRRLVPLLQNPSPFIVNIGSRMGAVIFGASLLGESDWKIAGIELNPEFAKLQMEFVKQHAFPNIEICCSDVRNQASMIQTADVVVMNNVFSFFMSAEERVSCWEFLHKNLKPGCVIIHNPAICDIAEHLPLSFKVEEWLQEKRLFEIAYEFCGTEKSTEYEDCTQLHMFRVIGS